MKYYKLINDNEFIGVCTTFDLRKFQKKHKIFLACNESEAQYIQCGDIMYRAIWMVPETVYQDCAVVDVIVIDKDEYDVLFKAVKSNKEIVIEQDEPEVPSMDINDSTFDFVYASKIAEMKSECNKTITNGFDVKLSDGIKHHFSLTIQDQLNLITSSQMIESGSNEIPYHADGELFVYYSVKDMQSIIDKANSFKNYHISYFNSLKTYINSFTNIDSIAAIYYGIEIPEEYQSTVFKKYL